MWCCFVGGNGLYLHEQIPLKPALLCGFGGSVCLAWQCYRKLHGAFHCRPVATLHVYAPLYGLEWICIKHLCVRTEPYGLLVTVSSRFALMVSGEELLGFCRVWKLWRAAMILSRTAVFSNTFSSFELMVLNDSGWSLENLIPNQSLYSMLYMYLKVPFKKDEALF